MRPDRYLKGHISELKSEEKESGLNDITVTDDYGIMADGHHVYATSGTCFKIFTLDGKMISDGMSNSVDLPAPAYIYTTAC